MSDMDLRLRGDYTQVCPTCGATLETIPTAYGSQVGVTCLVCYGDPESAPAEPVAEADEDEDEPEAPQTAAEAPLPREVGTDVTSEES